MTHASPLCVVSNVRCTEISGINHNLLYYELVIGDSFGMRSFLYCPAHASLVVSSPAVFSIYRFVSYASVWIYS